ncbi:hypothetical protein [Nostoc sp.]|uniref:hypothetical protein n=1 Tax=Nostoc sp. TaxID=1180 RepID=UPI002FF6C154
MSSPDKTEIAAIAQIPISGDRSNYFPRLAKIMILQIGDRLLQAISDLIGLPWRSDCGLVPQGGSQKSKVKSQKSKALWNKLFRAFQWSAYLRRTVLGFTYHTYILYKIWAFEPCLTPYRVNM